jgi:hypothetical protein
MSITLEAGKYYRTWDGEKVGPMEIVQLKGSTPGYLFCSEGRTYDTDGTYLNDDPSRYDLVAEWTDEPTSPEPTPWYPDDLGGWIEWGGGECPVPGARVEALLRNARLLKCDASRAWASEGFRWGHSGGARRHRRLPRRLSRSSSRSLCSRENASR